MASGNNKKKKHKKHITPLAYITVLILAAALVLLAYFLIPDQAKQEEHPTEPPTEQVTDPSSSETEDTTDTKETSSEQTESTSESASPSDTSETETSSETSSETASETEQTTSEEDPDVLTIDDVVFIGDSRTLTMGTGGDWEFALVPDDSLSATWGGQLPDESAFENARNAATKKRKIAVFWYGINDVQMNPERDNASIFISNYMNILNTYLEGWSGSEIYIVSILTTSVNERDYYEGQNANIMKYNNALKNLCNDCGYHFVDATALFTGEECFAPGDNIHFSKEWYEQSYLPLIKAEIGLQ